MLYCRINTFRSWTHTGCVSESGEFATLFFWFGNAGADAAIVISLPTLNRFSCNGVVYWRTMCFCSESVLQKRWLLWSLSVNFEENSGFIAILLFLQPVPSRPGFETLRLLVLHYTTNSMDTREYCGSEKGNLKNSTPFWASPLCVIRAVWRQRSMDFTNPTQFRNWNIQFSKMSNEFLWRCFKEYRVASARGLPIA
jgi:hypothetical protein